MDQHQIFRRGFKREEQIAHGILTQRAAGDGLGQAEIADCLIIEGAVIRMDGDSDAGDLRMPQKSLDGMAQHGPAGQQAILLGQRAAKAGTAAGRHDQGVAAGLKGLIGHGARP